MTDKSPRLTPLVMNQVIGVDNSDIVHSAREIVMENNLQDVVQILHGRIEDVRLPVDKVDIIISEWMVWTEESG